MAQYQHHHSSFKSLYLEGNVELVGIVDSDDSLVSGLVFIVEVKLDREHEDRNLPVQDTGGRGVGDGARGTHPDLIRLDLAGIIF